jgi:hypothetical protein
LQKIPDSGCPPKAPNFMNPVDKLDKRRCTAENGKDIFLQLRQNALQVLAGEKLLEKIENNR